MTIAIDAMGGDTYPRNQVLGAVKAVKERGIRTLLVGDESSIKRELDDCSYPAGKIEIVHASQAIDMDETVSSALRGKRNSSLRVCFDLHKSGQAEGVVSAGNSGAMLAIGRFVLKMVAGISRPCISALLPSLGGNVLLIDAGANMDCAPEQLLQFAILGHIYMSDLHTIQNPRIGLLNIGTEEGKGDESRRKTYELLKKSPLNFIGNVEGENFFSGDVDIVVTDGFAGNIFLKSVQAAAYFAVTVFEREIQKSRIARLGAKCMGASFRNLRKRTSYAEFGGAPLLGLKGNGIVCHGKSNPDAINSGIGLAQWASEQCLASRIEEKVQEFGLYLDSASATTR